MSEESSNLKGITTGIGRRKFLKKSALVIAGTGLSASFLAACGDNTSTSAPAATTAASSATGATTAASGAATTAASSGAPATLSLLIDDSTQSKDQANAIIEAYKKVRPNVTINIETRPGGADGDNLVKTRLATGEMNDVFFYNSGSLLQALKPTQTLVDFSKEPFVANLTDVYIPTVSQNGQIFGVPVGTGQGGGILYNKKIYSQLGLSVPKTWAEFEANNEKIKAAGITPVLQSYGGSDTWTSQLFVLADYYNVAQANSNFAQDYTANKIKFASDPVAMEGFSYLQEGFQKGWYQKDFATTKYEQALQLLADGKGAHYPMLSFALPTIQKNSPDKVNDIGFFGQPGKDAAKNGATIWIPGSAYIPKTTKNLAAAKDFVTYIASQAAIDAMNAKVAPSGPFFIKGTKLPDNALPAVKDIAAYIDAGKSTPALEFFSPVKGPSLEQICVAVGSGQMTPQQAAGNYDKDVEKQAKQLGLPGW
ncbi:MAG TPA: extracellular solute-binding protein [Chloroflexia bacterium]|nr:extracellular solute-binding protein [Chloroflexia bacterium]